MPVEFRVPFANANAADASIVTDGIARIERFPVRPRWLFLRVETKQGVVSWGEATFEGHLESVMSAA